MDHMSDEEFRLHYIIAPLVLSFEEEMLASFRDQLPMLVERLPRLIEKHKRSRYIEVPMRASDSAFAIYDTKSYTFTEIRTKVCNRPVKAAYMHLVREKDFTTVIIPIPRELMQARAVARKGSQ